MTRHNKHKSRAKLLRSLYIWHRYIGISTAIFVIVLTFTGLLLNHTDELELDAAYVQSDIMLDWYGINAPGELVSYQADAVYITAVNNKIFWDSKPLLHVSAPLAGVQAFGDLVVIVAAGRLVLFTAGGELVEKLENVAGVPTGIQAIGLSSQGLLAVKTARGNYQADENLLEWVRADGPEINWSSTQATEPALLRSLQKAYRGTGLPMERIMLDLHSGRILGRAGVYIMDAAAIGFLLLAASGVWLWLRRRTSVKAHRQKIRNTDADKK
jgi:hypothetical protein